MEYNVVQFLMNSYGCTETEGELIKQGMLERVHEEGEDPDEVLLEEGMEPDYLEDFLTGR